MGPARCCRAGGPWGPAEHPGLPCDPARGLVQHGQVRRGRRVQVSRTAETGEDVDLAGPAGVHLAKTGRRKEPLFFLSHCRQRLPSARPEAACEGGSQGGQRSAARWREVQALPSGPPAQGQWLPARDLLWPRSRRTFGLGPCAVGIGPWTIVCFLLVMGKAVVTVPSSNVRCGERRPTSGLPS